MADSCSDQSLGKQVGAPIEHSHCLTILVCRCDLSISAGSKAVATGDPVSSLDTLKQFILSDASSECWSRLSSSPDNSSVSIVMDNAGFELFSDLCLADFLITSKVIRYKYGLNKVRFLS